MGSASNQENGVSLLVRRLDCCARTLKRVASVTLSLLAEDAASPVSDSECWGRGESSRVLGESLKRDVKRLPPPDAPMKSLLETGSDSFFAHSTVCAVSDQLTHAFPPSRRHVTNQPNA